MGNNSESGRKAVAQLPNCGTAAFYKWNSVPVLNKRLLMSNWFRRQVLSGSVQMGKWQDKENKTGMQCSY